MLVSQINSSDWTCMIYATCLSDIFFCNFHPRACVVVEYLRCLRCSAVCLLCLLCIIMIICLRDCIFCQHLEYFQPQQAAFLKLSVLERLSALHVCLKHLRHSDWQISLCMRWQIFKFTSCLLQMWKIHRRSQTRHLVAISYGIILFLKW